MKSVDEVIPGPLFVTRCGWTSTVFVGRGGTVGRAIYLCATALRAVWDGAGTRPKETRGRGLSIVLPDCSNHLSSWLLL